MMTQTEEQTATDSQNNLSQLMNIPEHEIQTTSLVLNLPLRHSQIPRFRKAVGHIIAKDRDSGQALLTEEQYALFHNHDPKASKGRRTQPALIHYRVQKSTAPQTGEKHPIQQRQRHQAWLFGMGKGAEALQRFMLLTDKSCRIGGEEVVLTMRDFRVQTHILRPLKQPRSYRLRYWLALSPQIYQEHWLPAQNMHQRLTLLEGRLQQHLLRWAKAVGWELPQDLRPSISLLRQMRTTKAWDAQVLAFDLDYTLPLALPPGIALGRATSHGFGLQYPAKPPQ